MGSFGTSTICEGVDVYKIGLFGKRRIALPAPATYDAGRQAVTPRLP
jgi:hypothetical protein